ncbi:hypothetical protein [Desmospora activa]|uniref:CopG family transcriptional regulator n=1 Tax=Desmospora activa DSM 45169 TaxID=1121389 RepID=A0A2T4YY85_9BACL|nr:hypothetical protein [Desmospora activa]PTM51506.1 hypothetical protein C8J48_3769 [Desmospora activa DSM 45169]
MAKKNRQVSFNLNDEAERRLYEYAGRPDVNFSGLVKMLLFSYLERKGEEQK